MLHLAEFISNNSISTTLGISPFYALMGCNPSLYAEASQGEMPEGGVPAAVERAQRLSSERAALEQHWKRAQESQVKQYNKTHKPRSYQVG
jgi:hypothetical protein